MRTSRGGSAPSPRAFWRRCGPLASGPAADKARERQLVLVLNAIYQAEPDPLDAAEEILGDGQLFGTPQGMAARFLRPAYALRAIVN